MKLIVPVEIEVDGNDHAIEQLMQAVEFCLNDEAYQDARKFADAEELMPELEIISLRVVFPEHTGAPK
jgi:hypothetical protein